ncbi:hypothetical protein BDV29DRAFT_172089 [Aspergillus leporis]|uniref:Uncharacterized protein n=1 Tax=Aspergillus leporis TaxID=41062 RepID=A0A5N5X3R5_9EURO|nr:hypothetical protein BDV29DRAFT_172089 [Aspergillus leporis]
MDWTNRRLPGLRVLSHGGRPQPWQSKDHFGISTSPYIYVLLNPNPLRSSAIEDGSDRHNLTSQKDNLCHLRAVVSPIASHPASLSSSERYGVRKRRYAEKSMESLKSLPNKGPPKLFSPVRTLTSRLKSSIVNSVQAHQSVSPGGAPTNIWRFQPLRCSAWPF